MENRINIAELLKDCPSGMELDCTLYYNVFFDRICEDDDCLYPIKCYTIEDGIRDSVDFTEFGEFHTIIKSKCVIFPKGKTTWEGFHRPFVDGDIIYTKHKLGSEFVSIFQIEYERDMCTYWDINLSTNKLIGSLREGNAFKVFIEKDKVKEQRLATEEEKEKLFQVIKDNGYEWNAETKTLGKLIQPKFKVGDKITDKNKFIYRITEITDKGYKLHDLRTTFITFEEADLYFVKVVDVFDITTLKPFDKILVRDNDNTMWIATLFSHLREKRFYTVNTWYNQCIPFEGNQHLLGTTNDCDEFYKTWTNEEK